jgi:hypothetical protein
MKVSVFGSDRIAAIAQICHERNRQYCLSLGDESQPSWPDAPQWQKDSAINGVTFHLEALQRGEELNPAASHENWLKEKESAGWKYGPVKDPEKKEHPCCVPYDQLPTEQKFKDEIFIRTVKEAWNAAQLEEHRDVKQQRELNELNPHLAAPPSLPHQEPKKAVPGGPHQPSRDEDKHDSLGNVKDDAGPVGPRGAHVSPEHLSEEQKAESARQQHEREHRGMSSTAAVDSRGESKHIFVHEPQGNDRHGARLPDRNTGELVEEAPKHVGPRGIGAPKDTFHRS